MSAEFRSEIDEAAYADPEESRLVAAAWRAGQLAWMLRPYQFTIYETIWTLIERLRATRRGRDAWLGNVCAIESAPNAPNVSLPGLPAMEAYRVGVVVASRKIGKSFLEVLIAGEFAIRYPKSVIRLTAPTAVEARSIFEPEFEKVFQEAPAECKPRQKGVDRNWVFPNGSMIVLRGADMKPDRLRGPSSDLNLIDEASYITRLQYVVNSIMYPMTIHTKGATILCSTLNQSPSSEFNAYYEKCNALGQASILPITEAGFTDEELAQEHNAVDQTTWEIEYLCQMGRDPNQTIVPEWTTELAAECTAEPPVQTRENPELAYWHRLASVDFGTVDNSVVLTGFLEFSTKTLWITNEDLLQGAAVTGANIANLIKTLEAEDFVDRPRHGNAPEVTRVGDHNIEMLQTLNVDHQLSISKISKTELENMVNMLRTWVAQGRIRVSPKCVNLLACLRHGAWTTVAGTRSGSPRKRVFARTSLVDSRRRVLGHYDALAAAIYMCIKAEKLKNVNPLPVTFITAAQEARHGVYTAERYRKIEIQPGGGNAAGGRPGVPGSRLRVSPKGWTPPNARKKP